MEPTRTSLEGLEPIVPRPDWITRSTWFFVGLGVVLRLVRYATRQPLWGDEAYLAASLIERGFGDLLQPLAYHQVAPPLFVGAELAAVRLGGFSEWSLRLVPLIGGLVSLPLAAVAGRLALGRRGALLAVALLAVSFYPIRFATEAKPYATDLAVALALLALVLAWHRDPGPRRERWLWGLVAFAPLALGLSFPSLFVAGGLGIWLADRWRRTRASGAAILGVLASLGLSFGVLHGLVLRHQTSAAGDGTFAYWANAFPPRGNIPGLALWLAETHTSHTFAYPLGGAHGASVLTTLLAIAGSWALWRRGDRALVGLLAAPFGMGLLAAALGRYPYGGSTRTMQYVAPSILILAAAGAAWRLDVRWDSGTRFRLTRGLLGALAAIGIATTTMDVVRPYKFREDAQSRAFAQRFWAEQATDAVLVCPRLDLGLRLGADRHWETGRSAVYLCHQAAMFERRRLGRRPEWEQVGPDRPLRCVLFNTRLDNPGVGAWLDAMRRQGLEVVRCRELVGVPLHTVGGLDYEDHYEVVDFVPRRAGDPAEPMAQRAAEDSRLVR